MLGGISFAIHFTFYSSGDLIPWYVSGILLTIFSIIYWGFFSGLFRNILAVLRLVKPSKTLIQAIEDGEESEIGFFEEADPFQGRLFDPKKKVKSQLLRQGIPLLLVCLIGFAVCWMLSSTCFTLEPLSYSNKIMRAIQTDPCEGKVICHLYLTVSHNTSSSIIVIFHTTVKFDNAMVKFDNLPRDNIADYRISVESREREIMLDQKRYIYYTYLPNLEPNQEYYFVVGNGGNPSQHSTERKFKTSPKNLLESDIQFVTGGDWGDTENTYKLTRLAVSYDPEFIAIGGDLSYDNGQRTCYRRWDHWLFKWEEASVSPSNRTIPLLTAIGNHEAGGFEIKRTSTPLYLHYFVHNDVTDKSLPEDHPTYRKHATTGALILALDSDVFETPGGVQAQFIEQELNKSYEESYQYRFALYHAPLYPSARSENNRLSVKLRKHWKPLFDKYKLDIGFENHDHAYKRTKLIGENGFSDNGTLYIGDGAWGVKARHPAAHRDYFEAAHYGEFLIHVHMTFLGVELSAVNTEGKVFDKYVYKPREH